MQKLEIISKTEDGKQVLRGTFHLVSSVGIPLDMLAEQLDLRGFIVDWIDFYVESVREGWPPERTLIRLQQAVADVYGPDFYQEWNSRMQLSVNYLHRNRK